MQRDSVDGVDVRMHSDEIDAEQREQCHASEEN